MENAVHGHNDKRVRLMKGYCNRGPKRKRRALARLQIGSFKGTDPGTGQGATASDTSAVKTISSSVAKYFSSMPHSLASSTV